MLIRTALAASAVALVSACASSPMMKPFDQAGLPAAVQVPAGNKVFWETVGVGEITYECRAKAGAAEGVEQMRPQRGEVVLDGVRRLAL